MKQDDQLVELHHAVVEQGEVDYAHHKLLPRLRAGARGEKIPNHWYSGYIDPKELLEQAQRTVNNLVVIIERLTKDSRCGRCNNVGSVIERMGGCRDDNDSVVCPRCHGRYQLK